MRRWMCLAAALGLLGALSGCHCSIAHGVCDCVPDNYCYNRAPWIAYSAAPVAAAAPAAEAVPAPTKTAPTGGKGL